MQNLFGTLGRKVMDWHCHQWGHFSLWVRRNAAYQLPLAWCSPRD
jgi:hypothetical protein